MEIPASKSSKLNLKSFCRQFEGKKFLISDNLSIHAFTGILTSLVFIKSEKHGCHKQHPLDLYYYILTLFARIYLGNPCYKI